MSTPKWKAIVQKIRKVLDEIEERDDKDYAEKRLLCVVVDNVLVGLCSNKSAEYQMELIEELEDILQVPERW